MKTTIPMPLAATLSLLLVACDSNQSATKTAGQPSPTPSPTPALRPETRTLEGAAAIGVNSKQLRGNVDKILNLKDEHEKQLNEAAKPLDDQ